MPNILTITGPTASGKTKTALKQAEKFLEKNKEGKVILISADSKQVYAELSLLTGADIPHQWKKSSAKESCLETAPFPFFSNSYKNIELHGVSILTGDTSWGAGEFVQLAQALLTAENNQQILYIIVGGTGFYHQQLFSPAATLFQSAPPNPELRNKLKNLSLAELQTKLRMAWPERFATLNHSDLNNPRRLIRALEILDASPKKPVLTTSQNPYPRQTISLEIPQEELKKKIIARIEKRLAQGVLKEVATFEKNYPANDLPAKTALGYQEIRKYLLKEISKEELQQLWLAQELQYAKRQKTWWKKYS